LYRVIFSVKDNKYDLVHLVGRKLQTTLNQPVRGPTDREEESEKDRETNRGKGGRLTLKQPEEKKRRTLKEERNPKGNANRTFEQTKARKRGGSREECWGFIPEKIKTEREGRSREIGLFPTRKWSAGKRGNLRAGSSLLLKVPKNSEETKCRRGEVPLGETTGKMTWDRKDYLRLKKNCTTTTGDSRQSRDLLDTNQQRMGSGAGGMGGHGV